MKYSLEQVINTLMNMAVNMRANPHRSPLDNSHEIIAQAAFMLGGGRQMDRIEQIGAMIRREAVPAGTACQSTEQAVPETTSNDEQPP